MIRYIAILFVVLCSTSIGLLFSITVKERLFLLEDFYRTIINIKSQINYFNQPLDSLFQNMYDSPKSKGSLLISKVSKKLINEYKDVGLIWAETIDEIYGKTCLNKSDLELLNYPGSFLGQTDSYNQASHFEYLLCGLEEKINQAKEDYKTKGNLYIKIGFIAGLLLALLFC